MPQRKVQDLLEAVFARVRGLWKDDAAATSLTAGDPGGADGVERIIALAAALLAERSQSSGVYVALELLKGYAGLDGEGRSALLSALATNFAPDPEAIRRALAAYDDNPSPYALSLIGKAAEPPRQELLRRLNQAPTATAALVGMRSDLLRLLPDRPDLKALEADFVHLLRSWFNRGFLVMRRIDWSSPADLLDRIIKYEAVHSIATWEALRDRLLPADRRCYGFFHPALGDEPLIFVEVALCDHIPASIQSLLASGRPVLDTDAARVAVFYSISNCQPGLAGISFGQYLIKQVVDDLKGEFPHLDTFVTLSPVPGFIAWLERTAAAGDAAAQASLADGDPTPDWSIEDPRARARMALAARYFLIDRDARGRSMDPVARFHVGNGASVERLCWLGDLGPRGMKQSGGLMVNYLYDLATVEANHDGYARHGTIAASARVRGWLAPIVTGSGEAGASFQP